MNLNKLILTKKKLPLPSPVESLLSSKLISPLVLWARLQSRNFLASVFVFALTLAQVPLLGCVTVNVNFPESAVQKATDDYVKDLYRTKEKGKTPSAGTSGALGPSSIKILTEILLPTAHAAEAEDFQFRTNTDKTKEIQSRQASRLPELALVASGQWGESSLGYIEARFSADFKKKELLVKKIENLIKQENDDRKALYQEVLDANKLPPARLIDIQKKFANSFRDALPEGNWKQEDSGEWKKK